MLRVDGGERQRQLDLRATAVSGLAIALLCIGGTAVDPARGGSGGPWAVVCAVGGLTYAIALGAMRHRQ
jgi:hypothetical protein